MADNHTDRPLSWSRILRFSTDLVGIVPTVGGLWGLVRAAIWDEGNVTAAIAFTPGFAMQLYAALAAGGAFLLVRAYWPWLQSLRPVTRFGILAEQMGQLIQKADVERQQDILEGRPIGSPPFQLEADLRELAYELDKLCVPHPAVESIIDWYQWLPELYALAKTKRLKAARQSWREAE